MGSQYKCVEWRPPLGAYSLFVLQEDESDLFGYGMLIYSQLWVIIDRHKFDQIGKSLVPQLADRSQQAWR